MAIVDDATIMCHNPSDAMLVRFSSVLNTCRRCPLRRRPRHRCPRPRCRRGGGRGRGDGGGGDAAALSTPNPAPQALTQTSGPHTLSPVQI